MMDERENINISEHCDESSKQSPRDVSGTGLSAVVSTIT